MFDIEPGDYPNHQYERIDGEFSLVAAVLLLAPLLALMFAAFFAMCVA